MWMTSPVWSSRWATISVLRYCLAAKVASSKGQGIVFKEGHSVMLVFAANEQLQEGLTKTLKAVTGKAAKWRKGELVTFKASE